MELSELAAYAREKHTIQEQHKWADFPGFSVLAEPGTGKWAALLMRQWDGDTGEEVQRCDIKCGRQCLAEIRVPWLTLPFRMKGQNWVGVIFDGRTDPEIVFGLFDRAVGMIRQRRAYTVILEDLRGNTKGLYHDTALPQKEQDRGTALPPMRSRKIQETLRLPAPEQEHAPADSAPDSTEAWTRDFFREADGTGRYASTALPHIPQKIRDMMRLYEYQGESLEAKSRNFYRQGRFMEDYEDDASWTGEYRRYFTTYHDLHLPQLRGYFTWRTALRKGQFRPIASSLAYMYIYELLCGIGTSSPEDSLRKMREFEKGFLDSGIGDTFMRRNLHRWMLDYAVIHNVPVETARLYELPAIAERDLQLAVLKAPKDHSDEEIFAALCAFGGKKLPQSPVVADNGKTDNGKTENEKRKNGKTENGKTDGGKTGGGEKGRHLFAALWRYLTEHYGSGEEAAAPAGDTAGKLTAETEPTPPASAQARKNEMVSAGHPVESEDPAIFTDCFGVRKKSPWNPLSNAIHWEEDRPQEALYVLNACRIYRCHAGEWEEEHYENPCFAKDLLQGLLHAADRGFRRYLRTGHYLRAKAEEAWAEPYIEAVIAADLEADEKARIEAEKKAALDRIRIDLSGLDKIRRDALITRDSLLTEEEKAEEAEELFYQTRPGTDAGAGVTESEGFLAPADHSDEAVRGRIPGTGREEERESLPGAAESLDESARDRIPGTGRAEMKESPLSAEGPEETTKESKPAGPCSGEDAGTIDGLDALHTQILRTLLQDQSVDGLIREQHLMPAIVADTINEALFEEIGDNVLEWDEDHLILIEDYRADLADLFP
ncbi:MAG: hypothetical protein E7237_04400 [Sarcina sp.]|nr:hypothetical protein [Sarcina sp.]